MPDFSVESNFLNTPNISSNPKPPSNSFPKPSSELFKSLWSRYTSLVSSLQSKHYLPRKLSASMLAGIIGAVVIAGGSLAAFTLSQTSSDLRQQAYVAGPDGSGGGVIVGETGGDNTCGGTYKFKVFNGVQSTKCKTWERATNNGCQSDESCKMGVNQPCSDTVLCKSGLTCTPTSGSGKVCLAEVTNPAGGAQGGDPCQQLGTGWQQADLTCAAGQKKEDSRIGNSGAYCHRCVGKPTIKPGERCNDNQGCTCSTAANVAFGSKCPTSQAPAGSEIGTTDCCINPGQTQVEKKLTFGQCTQQGGVPRKCYKTNCYDYNKKCGLATIYDKSSCTGDFFPATSEGKTSCNERLEDSGDIFCYTMTVKSDGTYECVASNITNNLVCDVQAEHYNTLLECREALDAKPELEKLGPGQHCQANADGTKKTCICNQDSFNRGSIESPKYCLYSKCPEILSSGIPEGVLGGVACGTLPNRSIVYSCTQNLDPKTDSAGIWQVKENCDSRSLCYEGKCLPSDYVQCVLQLGSVTNYQNQKMLCEVKQQYSQNSQNSTSNFYWNDGLCGCNEAPKQLKNPIDYEQIMLEEEQGITLPRRSSPTPTPSPVSNQMPKSGVAEVTEIAEPETLELSFEENLDPEEQAVATGCRSYMGSNNAFDTNRDGFVAEGVCEYRPTENGTLHVCSNRIWQQVSDPGQCQQTDSTRELFSGRAESQQVDEVDCVTFSAMECPLSFCRVANNTCTDKVSETAPLTVEELELIEDLPVETGTPSISITQSIVRGVTDSVLGMIGLPSGSVLPPSSGTVIRCSNQPDRLVDINRSIDNSQVCLSDDEYKVECNSGYKYHKTTLFGIFTTSASCKPESQQNLPDTSQQDAQKPIAPDSPDSSSSYTSCAGYSVDECPVERCNVEDNQCHEIKQCSVLDTTHSTSTHYLMSTLDGNGSVLARVQRCQVSESGESTIGYVCKDGWTATIVSGALLCYQPNELDSLCRAQTDVESCENYQGVCSFNTVNNTCRRAL